MLIRLAQIFEKIQLDLDAQPAEGRVDPEWAKEESFSGFSKERIVIRTFLTMFAPVSYFLFYGNLWLMIWTWICPTHLD